MYAIETDALTKRFGDVVAVKNLDLRVGTGEVYGFVGPNGAGKSTTIGLLLDLLSPTKGDATILGFDAGTEQLEIRQRVGVLPERSGLYGRLSGAEHLAFVVDAMDASDRVSDLLGRVGLAGAGDRRARTYSTGMAQRLRLGMALVGSPELLILDEPASGLDPGGLSRLREIVRVERDRGAAVFFSSHGLEDVQAVCDRVGMLIEGELRVDTALAEVTAANARLHLHTSDRLSRLVSRLHEHPAVEDVGSTEEGVVVTLTCLSEKADILALAQETHEIRDFTIERGSLASAYERLVAEDQ